MWFWHVPALCDAATSNGIVRAVQIISLLALGTLFWLPIIGSGWRLPPLGGVFYLFSACIACTLLGIFITFAPISVCPIFMHPMGDAQVLSMIRDQWKLTPAIDQEIGGLLMWVPACMIYLSGIVCLLAKWYGEEAEPGATTHAAGHPRTA